MASAVRILAPVEIGVSAGVVLAAGKGFEPPDDVLTIVCRFTVGCVQPLCQPATENTKGQQSRFADWAMLVFCFHCATSIIKLLYAVKAQHLDGIIIF
jgi:hypothetical protein